MAMNHRLQEQTERDYVVARLDGPAPGQPRDLATLLRNDTLRKAVEKLMSMGHATRDGTHKRWALTSGGIPISHKSSFFSRRLFALTVGTQLHRP